jgi:hypothetical protein
VRGEDSNQQHQNPNPSNIEGFGTPRVSIVIQKELVPRTEGLATRRFVGRQGLGGCEHNSAATRWPHFGKELSAEVRADDSREQRQKPHPSHCEGFGTPRVSIVQAFTPVPRGRVGHPPQARLKSSPTTSRNYKNEGSATRLLRCRSEHAEHY